MFLPLRLVKCRVEVEARDTLRLPPYKGSCLRGALGHALKRVACTCNGTGPVTADDASGCVYHYLFEPVAPQRAGGPRGILHVPQPFVLDPPLDAKTEYAPGELMAFEFILIGRAVPCLPHMLAAFELMGIHGLGKGKGRFNISSLWKLNAADEAAPLDLGRFSTDEAGGDLITAQGIETSAPCPYFLDAVTLEFQTPTRLKSNSHLCDSPEFHTVYRNLARRLSLLSFFHCGGEWKDSIAAEIKLADRVRLVRHRLDWMDWRRYSSRQEKEMYLGGFVGRLGFRGELAPFWPYLVMGSHLHIGKGATFGLGKYRLVPGDFGDPIRASAGTPHPGIYKYVDRES